VLEQQGCDSFSTVIVRHRKRNFGFVAARSNHELANTHEVTVDRRHQRDVSVSLRIDHLSQLALWYRAADPKESVVRG